MEYLNEYHDDAENFALLLKSIAPLTNISVGKFVLKCVKGVNDTIQYNQTNMDLLENMHEYTFPILDGNLQLSLQLYENVNAHYRLFCYTKINGKAGMTFSVNLTTEKESENVIYLTQKIKFAEQYEGNSDIAKAHRRQKQIVFCDLLRKLNLEVENEDIILGIFDPSKKKFVNTTAERFLNDFIVVSMLKGHFQGNKGYQLEILPSFNKLDYIYNNSDVAERLLPLKIQKSSTNRNIPLSLRYKILVRDNFKCLKCGHSVSDGVKLHIDHKIPFSLGGLTEFNNLQTLCSDCNIGKSNRHIG